MIGRSHVTMLAVGALVLIAIMWSFHNEGKNLETQCERFELHFWSPPLEQCFRLEVPVHYLSPSTPPNTLRDNTQWWVVEYDHPGYNPDGYQNRQPLSFVEFKRELEWEHEKREYYER